jgi:hypothetical protein
MDAYKLFRRKGCEALCCVVPKASQLPASSARLTGASWDASNPEHLWHQKDSMMPLRGS